MSADRAAELLAEAVADLDAARAAKAARWVEACGLRVESLRGVLARAEIARRRTEGS